MNDIEYLEEKVISGGYCIGCGACIASFGPFASMVFDDFGQYKPRFDSLEMGDSDLLEVCPFSGMSLNEDTLAAKLFSSCCSTKENCIGFYDKIFAGHVEENNFRERASSGGITSWLLCELLNRDIIDAVIHVEGCRASKAGGKLARYTISYSPEELKRRSKSRYYPVEISSVIRRAKEIPARYAFVGLPCFIKAVRLLCTKDPILTERICYTFSLFCAHLKSIHFASMFAWQCGVRPKDIEYVDFRVKQQKPPANNYGVRIVGTNEEKVTVDEIRINRTFFGCSWGQGLFKIHACDYCDDLLGETADAAFGDAWIHPYVNDIRGTNLAIIRRPEITSIMQGAAQKERLKLDPLGPAEIIISESAGIRHRRQGLQWRLLMKKRAGEWYPQKRVSPRLGGISLRYWKIFKLRYRISIESHKVFKRAVEQDDFTVFTSGLDKLLKKYNFLYSGNFFQRNWKSIRWHLFKRILQPLGFKNS